jgi:pimeloyl-ACP methyl ester carboxylesterase
MRHLGPLIARSIRAQGRTFIEKAWHDPGGITPQIVAGYERPLQAEDWDRALWELTAASHPLRLEARLAELALPVMVVTGDDDRIVPTAESLQLAAGIPGAGLVVFQACGHVPQEECPEQFLDAVIPFILEAEK